MSLEHPGEQRGPPPRTSPPTTSHLSQSLTDLAPARSDHLLLLCPSSMLLLRYVFTIVQSFMTIGEEKKSSRLFDSRSTTFTRESVKSAFWVSFSWFQSEIHLGTAWSSSGGSCPTLCAHSPFRPPAGCCSTRLATCFQNIPARINLHNPAACLASNP